MSRQISPGGYVAGDSPAIEHGMNKALDRLMRRDI